MQIIRGKRASNHRHYMDRTNRIMEIILTKIKIQDQGTSLVTHRYAETKMINSF